VIAALTSRQPALHGGTARRAHPAMWTTHEPDETENDEADEPEDDQCGDADARPDVACSRYVVEGVFGTLAAAQAAPGVDRPLPGRTASGR
jgi:hypothetical protein